METTGRCEYPRSGCGPGASIPEPTPSERIPSAEYARRLAQGLQMAADAAMELAARMERAERGPEQRKTMTCPSCGRRVTHLICSSAGDKGVCSDCYRHLVAHQG